MLPKVFGDTRRREFLGRLRSDIRGWTAQGENVRASLAHSAKESVGIFLFTGPGIEMQAGHGAATRSGPIRPFIEHHLLLAGN
jgi:hypothetical protein